MDQFEFELRYLSYKGLSDRLSLTWEQDAILEMVYTSGKGELIKKLTETTPPELKILTGQTYTESKKQLIDTYKNDIFSKDSSGQTFTVSDYIERLEYELKVVKEMGYNTYFLIVQDFINWSKNNAIAVGPGRGSAAGSLMAWCTKITDVDPFPYGLLFERFLNPARVSMPDIDVDFEDEKRYEVIHYVRKKYGEERFAHIGTFMTLAAKAAFKDVARTMGMPFERSNALTELIAEKTIRESIKKSEELEAVYESDDLVKKTLDAAMKLEGNIRQTGVHACGMIIAPEEITKYTSVQYPPKASGEDQAVVSQFDYHALEDLGLLKMDFLGLRTLSLIKNTVKIVKAREEKKGNTLHPILQKYLATMNLELPLDDLTTYERVFQKGDTSGIFQFEGSGIRAFLVQLQANNIDDVAAMSALYRPGPLEFIPSYIKRKHGTEAIDYMLPELAKTLIETYGRSVMEEEKQKLIQDLEPILGNTYGIAVYQEQLMFLAQSMAGFSLAEADMLRRGIGKKIKSEIERIKGIFVDGSANFRQYKPETATVIYEKLIEPAASYSFNKSHAVAYGLISYQTAWLKAHYPIEFNAALLRSEEQNPDKLAQFISELQIQGYRVLPPHINDSFTHVSAIDDTIRLGFLSIKGVGYDVGETIEQERKANGPYTSLEDFITRNTSIINKKTIESLAKAGAFTGLVDRKTILDNLQAILDRSKNGGTDLSAGLFGGIMQPTLSLTPSPEAKKMEKLLMEYDVFKTFVSGHPFDGLYQYVKKKYSLISAIKNAENAGDIKILCYVKNFQRAKKKGFFIKVEDLSDEIEFFVKDTFDREKFDILIIEGYKAKNIRLQKVTKTTLEYLITEATKAGKYDPKETIADIKVKRLGRDILSHSIPEILGENNVAWGGEVDNAHLSASTSNIAILPSIEEIEEEFLSDAEEYNALGEDIVPIDHDDMISSAEMFSDRNSDRDVDAVQYSHEDISKESPENTHQSAVLEKGPMLINAPTFTLPSDASILQKLIQIIKNNPGEIEILIDTKKIYVSSEGLCAIQTLLDI